MGPLKKDRGTKEAAAPSDPTSRKSKRQAARERARRRKAAFWALTALTVALVAAGAVALVAFSPPPTAPSAPPPGAAEDIPMHIHPHLAILRGQQEANLPPDIGSNPNHWNFHDLDTYSQAPGFAPIHTHDSTGDIHVESTVTRAYTLGEFFAIWGQPFGPDQVVDLVPDANHTLTMKVDGVESTAWGSLVLEDQQQIEVHYDTV